MHQYSYTILELSECKNGKKMAVPCELNNQWLGQVSHEFFSSTLAHKIANLCRRRLTGTDKIDEDFDLRFGIIKLHKNGMPKYTQGKRHEGRIFNANVKKKKEPVVIHLKDGTEYTVNWDVKLDDPNDTIRSYFSDKKGDILEQMHNPHDLKPSVTVSKRKDPELEKNKNEPKSLKIPKETKPKETKPNETKPKEAKSKETKPKETKPKETKPKETKPKETKPKETKPKETKPKDKK